MKKVVPTLLLILAVLFGKAQAPSIWFNELVPDPGPNEDEYIEFYNTSTTPISLDCYFVVSYFETNQERGIYVYNFPTNATIQGLSYYMISSDNPVRYKSNDNSLIYTPTDFTSFNNWNAIGSGGYISKYNYSNKGSGTNTWGTAQPVGGDFNDFITIAHGMDAVLLLYKINNDGSTQYVNGFIANPGSDVTAMLTSMESLGSLPINADGSCVSNTTPVQLDFNGLSNRNFDIITIQEATGRGQGYAKKGDGFCGNWEKIQKGEFSPGEKNNFGTTTSDITTVENYYCNNSVSFSIQSGTSKFFPIEVQLFYDKGTIGAFDAADEYKSSIIVQSTNDSYHTFTVADINQPVLLVYKSSTGCFNKIGVPSPAITPSLTITGSISCTPNANNKRTVTYQIGNISSTSVFPLTLQYTEDNGTPGNTSDDIITQVQSITSTSPLSSTVELKNNYSNVTLTVTSAIACITRSVLVPNGCTVLPVRFRSFTAVRNNNTKEQVILKWQTASEQNNRGFNIQRKVSGEWKNIAFVTSQARIGNSNTTLSYEYTDLNTFITATQYRLQQVDMDGKTSFSDVITVSPPEQRGSALIYPNPGINGMVNVLIKEQYAVKHIIVYDATGRLVQQFPETRDNMLTIKGLQKGFYTIKIIDRSTMVTSVEKVIIN